MGTPNPREFFSAEYEELRRVASRVLRQDPRSTLNPTGLIHEAFLKVVDSASLRPASNLHLKRIIARSMRQVLVEAARRRSADKRGAGYALVAFDEEAMGIPSGADDLLTLDAALEELALMNERHAQLVDYRVFGGYEFAEIAELMEVSRATVMRDWRAVRAWLALQIRRAG